MEAKSFFWGMTLHPEKRYAQTALEPFHISKACIEPSSLKKGDGKALTSVYLESENEEFLLCTLGSNNLNENLDLNFNKGEKICVRAEGGGVIHLTGFLMETPEYEIDDFDEDSSGSDGEEEESEVEEVQEMKKSKVVNGVAKKATPLDELVKAAKTKEKPKKPEEVLAEIKKAEEMKKKLTAESKKDESDEDEDDEDSDDENMLELEAKEEDDSDDEDEEEDSSDDEEEGEEEEDTPKKKAPETTKDKKPAKENAEKKKLENPKTPAQNTPAEKKKGDNVANGDKKKADQTPGKGTEGKKKEAKTPGKDAVNSKGDSGQETPGKTPKKTLKGGLIVEDLKVGAGPESKPGKMAAVYYVGKLKSNNKQFDACKEGKPFKFRVGQGEVIKAWDLGVAGMKVGGKRRLICPPQLAYGAKGAPPDIPPNSTLVFEVELKAVN